MGGGGRLPQHPLLEQPESEGIRLPSKSQQPAASTRTVQYESEDEPHLRRIMSMGLETNEAQTAHTRKVQAKNDRQLPAVAAVPTVSALAVTPSAGYLLPASQAAGEIRASVLVALPC